MRTHIHLYPLVLAILVMVACDSKTKTVEACGDGFVDPGEDCDTTTGENTCASLGYYNLIGELRCKSDCTWDASSCGGRCGDGNVDIDDGEECDSTDLNGNSCQALGYEGGILTCLEDCHFNVGRCDGACGNGTPENGEECEDGNVRNGDGCSSTCSIEPGWSCTDEVPTHCTTFCGDGIAAGSEVCDGADIRGNSCPSGGTVTCNELCDELIYDCIPECNNGYREGTEECDQTDLDNKSCADIAGFSGGTLGCTADCRFDTEHCSELCYVEENFSPCNPLIEYECCSHNDMPSICSDLGGSIEPVCLQTCNLSEDCGWSFICDADQGSICLPSDCALGSIGGDPCLIDNREGTCIQTGRALDERVECQEDGTLSVGDTCPVSDPNGRLGVDPATQCDGSLCVGTTGATIGQCMSFCDALAVYQTHTDPCPVNSTCVNTSTIDLYEFLDDGNANPNFLFRTPDQGICHTWQAGNEIYTCDLLTGHVIRGPNPGGACPDGQVCAVMWSNVVHAYSSLMGRCRNSTSLNLEGSWCNIGYNSPYPSECAAGLECFISDPFNTDGQTLACRRICHAPADGSITDATANAACAGLVDGNGDAYVCLTTSRFFTSDRELPTYGSGGDMVTETNPSPLGFCVPPLAN